MAFGSDVRIRVLDPSGDTRSSGCRWRNAASERGDASLNYDPSGLVGSRLCRLSYVIGLMPCTLRGPRHVPRWPSKLTGKLAESSLGGDSYAIGEIVDHTSLPRGLCGPLADPSREYPHPHEDKADNRGEVFGPSLPENAAVVRTCGIGQRVLASGLREPSGMSGRGERRNGSHPTITETGDLLTGNPSATTWHFIQRGRRVVPHFTFPPPISTRLCNTYRVSGN